MKILDHYQEEKRRYLEKCVQCGLCAKGCPILPETDGRDISPRGIQQQVHAFVAHGVASPEAYTKAFACMECFKCTVGMCPEGLDPMLVNEVVKHGYISRGVAQKAYSDPAAADSAHRVLASIQVSAEDYRRITRTDGKKRARTVFFPGCNVYFQPEKILSALDIMDALGDDYAFLPGLDHCCGDGLLFTGEIPEGAKKAEALVAAIADFRPEAVVLWCPTCQCRFHQTILPAMDDNPFEVVSFPQYLAANMDRLPLSDAAVGTVTLHEPCKSAYTGVDRDGPRAVLRRLPGVTLTEMVHHGAQAMCCGSGAVSWFPESFARMRDRRLDEAAATGADRLVTVCHYCNQAFAAEEAGFDFTVTSYVSLVAEALGIGRVDKFKRYARWANLERIMADAAGPLAASPFDRQRVIEVLQAVFGC